MTEEELDPELDSNPKRLKLHSPEDDTNGISLKFCTDIYLWICNILSLFKNVTECCDSLSTYNSRKYLTKITIGKLVKLLKTQATASNSDPTLLTVYRLNQFLTHTVSERSQYSGRLGVLGQFLRRVIEENKSRFIAETWHHVGTVHEHLHLVHSCQRFNGQCRCYFNRTVSKFGKPGYRSVVKPDNYQGFSIIIQYIGDKRQNYYFHILRRNGRRSITYLNGISTERNSEHPPEELVVTPIERSNTGLNRRAPSEKRTQATGHLIATVQSHLEKEMKAGLTIKKKVSTRN